jgi:hypothetical protein
LLDLPWGNLQHEGRWAAILVAMSRRLRSAANFLVVCSMILMSSPWHETQQKNNICSSSMFFMSLSPWLFTFHSKTRWSCLKLQSTAGICQHLPYNFEAKNP